MPARKRVSSDGWVLVVLTVAGFAAGMIANAFSLAEKMATKPYVDDKTAEVRAFAIEQDRTVLDKAHSHSDSNRAAMENKLETYSADMKAQAVKLDMILDSVRELRSQRVK